MLLTISRQVGDILGKQAFAIFFSEASLSLLLWRFFRSGDFQRKSTTATNNTAIELTPWISNCVLWLKNDANENSSLITLSICCCSLAKLCPTLCDFIYCSTPGFPVLHHFLELAQTHVHWVSNAIQPSHPLSSPSPPAFHLSQHQGLFQRVGPPHQVAKVLEFQHLSFQWIFRTDFL